MVTVLSIVVFYAFNVAVVVSVLVIVFDFNNAPVVKICKLVRVRVNQRVYQLGLSSTKAPYLSCIIFLAIYIYPEELSF